MNLKFPLINVLPAILLYFLSILFSTQIHAISCSNSSTGLFDSKFDRNNVLDHLSRACHQAIAKHDGEKENKSFGIFGGSHRNLPESAYKADNKSGFERDFHSGDESDGRSRHSPTSFWHEYEDIEEMFERNRKHDNKWSYYDSDEYDSEDSRSHGHGKKHKDKHWKDKERHWPQKHWPGHGCHKHHGCDAPPVPLPGAFWLFVSGFLGIVTLSRRRA